MPLKFREGEFGRENQVVRATKRRSLWGGRVPFEAEGTTFLVSGGSQLLRGVALVRVGVSWFVSFREGGRITFLFSSIMRFFVLSWQFDFVRSFGAGMSVFFTLVTTDLFQFAVCVEVYESPFYRDEMWSFLPSWLNRVIISFVTMCCTGRFISFTSW